ncbi:unnamed protein product, partial [Coregonus sp. 'balchen']
MRLLIAGMKLEVNTLGWGEAGIRWSDLPQKVIDLGVKVALFKDNNGQTQTTSTSVSTANGVYDTWVTLNPGLQVRLPTSKPWWSSDGNLEGLRFYTKNNYACARLFVKKFFTDWKDGFYSSW